MFKRLLLPLFLLLSASALAQSGTVTVTGSYLDNSSGVPISNATIFFAPVDAQGSPLSYKLGGATGGQVITHPASANVSNGHFQLTLADTSMTTPLNVCFSVTVQDNVTGKQLLGPGYSCVQPAYSNSWCTDGVCAFDSYVPDSSVGIGPAGGGGNTVAGVASINGATGAIQIGGLGVTQSGNNINFNAVTSINNEVGAMTFTGPGVSQNGNTFTFSGTGSGAGITSINGLTGALTFTGPVSCSGTTCTWTTPANAITYQTNVSPPIGYIPEAAAESNQLGVSSISDNGYRVATSEPFQSPTITAAGVDSSGNPVAPSTNALLDLPSIGSVPSTPASKTVRVTVPNSVTSYVLELPGAQPTTGNTLLSCTAANPSVCSWSASSAATTPGTPSYIADAGAGTGSNLSVSFAPGSTDLGGFITVVIGASPSASAGIVTITFGNSSYFKNPPPCHIWPANGNALALSGTQVPWVPASQITTTQWVLTSGSTALASTNYEWGYSCQ